MFNRFEPRRSTVAVRVVCLLTACLAAPWPGGVACTGGVRSRADSAQAGRVTVMTQNIYVGAPLEVLFDPELEPDDFPFVAAEIWGVVQATNFAERAAALADRIAREGPQLIGLQEVSVFHTQTPGDAAFGGTSSAIDPALDFQQILLEALSARGLDYDAVSATRNFTGEFPIYDQASPNQTTDVRLTDFDVILARNDVVVSNPRHGEYAARLEVRVGGAPFPIRRGWASVDARVRGLSFRFLTTHLEPREEDPAIQVTQGNELLAAVDSLNDHHGWLPTIVTGDLNSAADGSETPTYGNLIAAGFTDAWGDQGGNTCCQAGHLLNRPSQLDRRYDLILLSRDFEVAAPDFRGAIRATTLGDLESDRTRSGLWPSDHAGVAATIEWQHRSGG